MESKDEDNATETEMERIQNFPVPIQNHKQYHFIKQRVP
jgi:hypothetical protein